MEEQTKTQIEASANSDGSKPQVKPGVGQLLKATRMRIGSELTDISVALRIRRPYLEAIEEERYEDLPGSAYTIGFIKSYADYLGLDALEVVRRYKNENLIAKKKQNLVFPVPIAEDSIPGYSTMFFGALVVFFAYSIWHLGTTKDDFLSEAVTLIPQQLSDLMGGSGEPLSHDSISEAAKAPGIEKFNTSGEARNSSKQGSDIVGKENENSKFDDKTDLNSPSKESEKLARTSKNLSGEGDDGKEPQLADVEQQLRKEDDTPAIQLPDAKIGEVKNNADKPTQLKNQGTGNATSDLLEVGSSSDDKATNMGANNSFSQMVPEKDIKKITNINPSQSLETREEVVKLESENVSDESVYKVKPNDISDPPNTPEPISENIETIPSDDSNKEVARDLGAQNISSELPTQTGTPDKADDSPAQPVQSEVLLEGISKVPSLNPTKPKVEAEGKKAPDDSQSADSINLLGAALKEVNISPKTGHDGEEIVAAKIDTVVDFSGGETQEQGQEAVSELVEPEIEKNRALTGEGFHSIKPDESIENSVLGTITQDSLLEGDISEEIVIVAKGNSWIQIRDDINNKMLMTRLMQIGDQYTVPDQEGLHLLTGNAGALEILVGGVKVPSVGGDGVVRRNVILDGERLKAGTAVDE